MFDVIIPNADSITSLLNEFLPEKPDHLLYCISSYKQSCPYGFKVIQVYSTELCDYTEYEGDLTL